MPSVPTQPLPKGMELWYCDDEGIRKNRKDHYGDELRFALAGDLKNLKWPTKMSSTNKAIRAFLKALPEDTPVILYWS